MLEIAEHPEKLESAATADALAKHIANLKKLNPRHLYEVRARRDKELYALGWRPQPAYIEQHYGIPQEQFSIAPAGCQILPAE